ncbi:MAG: hypothetical protein LUC83_00960 [Clostridiales bacterium]|nr:hypothetical protein [Clostridiales bacterium]
MKESAQNILKRALAEQMETEARSVPPTEEIRKQHIFSETFLEKMRLLLRSQEKAARGKQSEEALREKVTRGKQEGEGSPEEEPVREKQDENKILRIFFAMRIKTKAMRIAAACLACVIILGAGLLGYQGLLRAGRSGADLASSYTTDGIDEAADESGMDMNETGAAEESVAGVEDMADEEETAGAESNDTGENDRNSGSGNGAAAEDAAENSVRMAMLDGKLYVDTGETSQAARCGVMDFCFDSSVEEGEPTENYQTNFGLGYEGQYGARENRIEIYIDGTWCVFAYHENDYAGASLAVDHVTDESVILEIRNETGEEFTYGEAYLLEYYAEEIDTWTVVSAENEVAYEDIVYRIQDDGADTWEADLADAYGSLSGGTYRIVKEVQSCADEVCYTLTAEFEIE